MVVFWLAISVFTGGDLETVQQELAQLLGNSTKELVGNGEYMETEAQFESGKSGLLVITERYLAANGRLNMTEVRKVPYAQIEKVRVLRDEKMGPPEGRSYYVLIQYQVAASNVYQYDSQTTDAFATLRSFRLGVYTRDQAAAIKEHLAQLKKFGSKL